MGHCYDRGWSTHVVHRVTLNSMHPKCYGDDRSIRFRMMYDPIALSGFRPRTPDSQKSRHSLGTRRAWECFHALMDGRALTATELARVAGVITVRYRDPNDIGFPALCRNAALRCVMRRTASRLQAPQSSSVCVTITSTGLSSRNGCTLPKRSPQSGSYGEFVENPDRFGYDLAAACRP